MKKKTWAEIVKEVSRFIIAIDRNPSTWTAGEQTCKYKVNENLSWMPE